MKTIIQLSFVLFLLSLISCLQVQPPEETTFTKKMDSLFRTIPDFSGVILVAENDKPVYHKAFGYHTVGAKSPLDTTAIFELASVSKQFTAMIIMMLKEKDLLSYDDTVGNYIPGLPYPGITIRHLLNHTSGLPDYQAIMDKYWDKTKVAGNKENIEYLKRYHPKANFVPGEKYEYSNTGYMLLASIAEKVSGKDFIQLCREQIFMPVEMAHTAIRTKENKVQLTNTAWGHIYVTEKKKYIQADSFPDFNYSIWLGDRKGPGRISAPASDLLKWDQALYDDQLVSKETLQEAFSPATLNDGTLSPYGFGWRLDKHPLLGTKIFHTGDNPGYKTIIIRFTDVHKTLILLCNNAHAKFEDTVKKIEKEMFY